MKNTRRITMSPIGRFIDPLTDFGFKRIFGSEPNKDLLIIFLNELFKGQKIIKDLVYNPQENSGPHNIIVKPFSTLPVQVPTAKLISLRYKEPNKSFSLTGLSFILQVSCTNRDRKVTRIGILS